MYIIMHEIKATWQRHNYMYIYAWNKANFRNWKRVHIAKIEKHDLYLKNHATVEFFLLEIRDKIIQSGIRFPS